MAGDYFLGLMSGTSLDGVDSVLTSFGAAGFRLHQSHHAPFPPELKEELLALQSPSDGELHRAAMAAQALSRCYAEAIQATLAKSQLPLASIAAIGCHGQTVRHRPDAAYTLQLNNPALLAELTGLTVVADFRSRDIAAGGQGAPLVPAFHDALFRMPGRHRAIVNIGGMANITELCPGQVTRGFDCGPGNVLLDAWISHQRELPFDEDGQWATEGRIIEDLLARLLAHPFFALAPPKSCGREQFQIGWLRSALTGEEQATDVQATLLELSAVTIAKALANYCPSADEVYLCGGGARNGALRRRIAAHLPGKTHLATTAELGLDVNWVEAAAFAWLAHECLAGRPASLPAVTGAKGARILGAIYPA